ncbi:stage III sporulation protein AG [Rossellomorea vietnamensis]|uniref:stage III sporulation protein AG n=1 Tax=Rossellomorea TaxID=2837508 RepID=UPI001CC95BF0|nr:MULTISPECIES: stage III sporulation protein AG [Rossellomorea]MCA0147657.1 stage III sporulation protein AG [Rossellomorea vietnamensis]UTE76292.1 stage III sporulation protein AG [Rossellomorea sp. KS-H15a]
MNFNKGPLNMLKEWLSKEDANSPPRGKKGKRLHYFLIVLLIGVAFMLISDLWSGDQGVEVAKQVDGGTPEEVATFGSGQKESDGSMRDYEDRYENQLKEALDQIVGVSDVYVVVNVEATESKVYEKNESTKTQSTDEEDKEGGKRSIEDKSREEEIVIVNNGDKEVPIVKETKKPKVTGVLVVAKGADNIQIKKWIIEAVTRALDVPSHRVSVLPKQ